MNTTKDINVKTIRFSTDTDSKIAKLTQRFGRSKLLLFNQMVDYFYRTKKDPLDISDEALRNTLVKNHDTYIRFIRTQEEKILIPVKDRTDQMIESQKKILERFNKQILDYNNDLLKAHKDLLEKSEAHRKNQQAQIQKFSETDQLMLNVYQRLQTREILKRSFLLILDSYIKARNSFGMTTPQVKRDELDKRTHKQVEML